MSPDAARATYTRMFTTRGRLVTLRRYAGDVATTRTETDASVAAVVTTYSANEITGRIQEGDRRAIILADTPALDGFPVPPRRTDKILILTKEYNVEEVDDHTRRIGEILIAYELRIRG